MDEYFSDAAIPGQATEVARFITLDRDVPRLGITDGLEFQPVVGGRLMLNLVTFEPHTEAPMHSHGEEQLVYVLEGEVLFTAGDVEQLLRPGEAVVIPPFVPHAARTLDVPCLELDIFAPPRQALLDLLEEADTDLLDTRDDPV